MTTPLVGADGMVAAAARLPVEAASIITTLAEKMDKTTAELVGQLAMEGLECRRQHQIGPKGKRR